MMRANEQREYRGVKIEKRYSRFSREYRFFLSYGPLAPEDLEEREKLFAPGPEDERFLHFFVAPGLREAKRAIDEVYRRVGA